MKKRIVLFSLLIIFLSVGNVLAFTDAGKFSVELDRKYIDTTSMSISPTIRLTNISNNHINLSDVKIRYYYTSEGFGEQNYWVDKATITGPAQNDSIDSAVDGKFTMLSPHTDTANYYLELSFSSGKIQTESTVEVSGDIRKIDWSNYDTSNDFSDKAENIAIFINGNLVWGNEPNRAPQINNSYESNYDIENGKTLNLPVIDATDPDGDTLNYTITKGPGVMNGNEYSFSPDSDYVNDATGYIKEDVIIEVSDGENITPIEFSVTTYSGSYRLELDRKYEDTTTYKMEPTIRFMKTLLKM